MTPCPWLQVKILQIIQMFPPPPANSQLLNDINSQIKRIYKFVEVTKHVNKNNSDHSILFEAINLAIMYEHHTYEMCLEVSHSETIYYMMIAPVPSGGGGGGCGG